MKKIVILSFFILFTVPTVWAQEKVEAPVWNVGDKWTYKDATGGIWTNEVVEVKEDLFIGKRGEFQDLVAYDRKTMNMKYMIDTSGRRIKSTSVLRKLWDFPIIIGKKWTDRTTSPPLGGTGDVNFLHEFKVEGIEEVTTPAGTFKAYRIHYKQKNLSSGRDGWIRFWYSPEAKAWVKRVSEESGFWARFITARNAELISYELK